MFEPLDAARVLFEDHHLLVVNKPAPLLTQAPPLVPSLEAMAKSYVKAKYAKPGGVYLAVPHRLDRPVSGVICFVRNSKAAHRVHRQFEERRVAKVYWALVSGVAEPAAGEWHDLIRKVDGEARVERGVDGDAASKPASLHYRVLNVFGNQSLLELKPLTGRMHQLRVQCAWRGHPVLGDWLYGPAEAFGPPAERERDRVIALHAQSLQIHHPFGDEPLTFTAPLPEYWPQPAIEMSLRG